MSMLLVGLIAGLTVAFPAGAAVVPLCVGCLAWLQYSHAQRAALWLFLWFFAYLCASLSWMVWALQTPHAWNFTWALFLLILGFAAHAAVYPFVWLILVRGRPWRWGFSAAISKPLPPLATATILGITVFLADIVRTQSDLGIAWGFIGYSQVNNPLLSGYFPVLGIYGVSGLLAFCSALLALALRTQLAKPCDSTSSRSNYHWFSLLTLSVFVMLCSLLFKRVQWTTPTETRLQVRAIHTNMLDSLKYEPQARQASQDLLLELAARSDAALTLYPELFLVAPAHEYRPEWRQNIVAAIASSGNQQLVGMPDALLDGSGVILGMTNALVQLGPHGAIARRPKEKLIPFAEQTSLGSGGWLNALLPLTAYPNSNFLPAGVGDTRALNVQGVPMSVSICSEIINPLVFHARSSQGQLMLSSSSESWIVSATLKGLLVQAVKARVLEAQKPMLRSANVGLSGYIDESASIQQTEELETVFTAIPQRGNTPFTVWMSWLYNLFA